MKQQVNLYHPIFRKEQKKFSAATMLQGSLLVLAGISLMYGYTWWRTVALRVQLKDVEAQQSAAVARLNDVSRNLPMRHADPRLEREVRDLDLRIQTIQQIRTASRPDLFMAVPGYSDYLVALARQSGAGLWVTGLMISGAGESVVLAGRTRDPELLPRYLQRLAGERPFAGLQFEIFQMTRPVHTPANAEKDTPEVLEPYVEFELRTKSPEKKK